MSGGMGRGRGEDRNAEVTFAGKWEVRVAESS